MTDRLRRAWHAGPRELPSLPLAASLVAVAALSAYSIIPVVEAVFSGYYAFDWENFVEAASRLGEGTLYEIEYPYAFRWSPVAAWLLGVVTLMPLWAWQALHVAVLPLLRSWWLVAACLVTYPLWFDIQTGNIMIFVGVAGFWAYRGNPAATALFLGLAVLVPRPLMLPLAIWILWARPAWRLPFGLFLIGHTVVVAASGYLGAWIASLFTVAPELASDFNFGPSRFIGVLWVPIGAVLAAWLVTRRRLGLSSLAISPYWLPYYFLMLLLEAVKPVPETAPLPERQGERIAEGARTPFGTIDQWSEARGAVLRSSPVNDHPNAHAHAHANRDAFESEREWAEWVRDYYRDIETYDWVDVADHWRGLESVFHRNRRRAVRRLLRQCQAQPPMLDAGCGTGLNLASLPAGSVGIDLNPRNVALVRQRLPDQRVVEGDIEDLPFADGEFATVLCTEVLEHVPYPDRALAEIRRVLRPGGQLIGSVPARSLVWRFRFLSSTCPQDEPFHNEYVPSEVAEMLRGFDRVRIWYSALRFNVLFVAQREE